MCQSLRKLSLCVFILSLQPGFAESLRFNTLNSSNGLPQDSIRWITQDDNGFMWFATEDGIARYDGSFLKTYRYNPEDPHSIIQNVAYQFLPDNKGRLWITTQGEGVLVLDQKSGEFMQVTDQSNAAIPQKLGSFVSAIYQRSDSEMLVGSRNGVFSISTEDLTATKQLISRDRLGNKQVVNAIWEDERANVWVSSGDGKLAYLSQNGDVTIVNNHASNFYSTKFIPRIGTVLAAGKQGIFKIDYLKNKLVPILMDVLPNNTSVFDIEQSSDNLLWLATRSGLIRHNTKSKETLLIQKNREDENAISSNRLTKLYLSRENILWIGSSENGINYINLNHYGFTSFSAYDPKTIAPNSAQSSVQKSISSNVIWSIFKDKQDTLWVGSNGGISFRKKNSNQFMNSKSLGDEKHKVSFDSIWSIAQANGYLWFGTWGSGLIRYSPKSRETLVFSTTSEKKISGDIIRLLLFDPIRNSLWVGTQYNGLNQINFNTGEIRHFQAAPNKPGGLPHPWIRSLYLDSENRLWVGTGGKLALYLDESNSFRVQPDNSKFQITDVRGIYQQDENTLWLSSAYGLHKFNIQDFDVDKSFQEKDGLSRSALYSLIPDDKGDLWITSTHGLTKFRSKEEIFKRYFVAHNLQSDEFNFNAHWKDDDGTIYVGGPGGITQFNPEQVDSNYESHQPVILGVSGYDTDLTEKQLINTTRFSIDDNHALISEARRRKLSFDFTTPEYIFRDKIKYRYRLLGNDDAWTDATNKDTPVQYTNLAAGNYEFQLQSVDDYLDNAKSINISITIQPYLWEKWWFQLLLGLMMIVVLFALIHRWLSRKLEQQLTRDRSMHYQMVVHDLGPSLNRSKENIQTLEQYFTNTGKTLPDGLINLRIDTQYAFSFIKQLRTICEVEGYPSKKKEEFLLEDLIYESIIPFRKHRERIKISDIPDASVCIYENSISFIIINLISNAISYSEDGSPIKLIITANEKDLKITVSDQGSGISDAVKDIILEPYTRENIYAVEGLGIGLSLVKSITSKYSGSISINHNDPNGSIISVILKNIIYHESTTK